MADGHDYIKRLSDFLQPISGPIGAFIQPSIDLAGRVQHYATGAVDDAIHPVLRTLLGGAGGDLMSDTLSPMIAMSGMPEAGEFPRIPPDPNIQGYRAPMETPAIRRGTQFLGEAEPRYHGTSNPIPIVRPPQVASSQSNLYGPGFYTTDSLPVAQGYSAGGPQYHVYEVNPDLKLLHAEEPIPGKVLQKLGERHGADEWTQPVVKRTPGSPNFPLSEQQFGESPMTLEDFMGHERYRLRVRTKLAQPGESPSETATRELFDALKEEGYGGIEHIGGKIMGGDPHNVKIYWNPEQDIRIRPMSGPRQFGDRSWSDYTPPANDLEEAMRKMREADRRMSPAAPPIPESVSAPIYHDPITGRVGFDPAIAPADEADLVHRMKMLGRSQTDILSALQRFRQNKWLK